MGGDRQGVQGRSWVETGRGCRGGHGWRQAGGAGVVMGGDRQGGAGAVMGGDRQGVQGRSWVETGRGVQGRSWVKTGTHMTATSTRHGN